MSETTALATPLGVPTKLDPIAYVTKLDDGRPTPLLPTLRDAGIDLEGVTVIRLELKAKFDKAALRTLLAEIPRGQIIHICQNRISGAEEQKKLGHSLPQQEWNNAAGALRAGARYLLVIVETASAKPRRRRAIFDEMVQLMASGRVVAFWTASVDRPTRWVLDGCRLVEAAQDTGTALMIAGSDMYATVATEPMLAMMLIIQFAMNSVHVVLISSGLRRVWRDRILRGEWPKGNLVIGMDLDKAGRPYMTEESKAVVQKIFALVANGTTPKQVAEIIRRDHPEWVSRMETKSAPRGVPRSPTPLTPLRIERLIATRALVTGRQVFDFREEKLEGTFAMLQGIISDEIQARATGKLLAMEAKRKFDRRSPWATLLQELLITHRHPLELLVQHSRVLRWEPDGTFALACPHCTGENEDGESGLIETTGDYEDVQLVNGDTRRGMRIPRFRCSACERTCLPLGKEALTWLLAGLRTVRCPFCPNPRLDLVRTERNADGFHDAGYKGTCETCHEETPVPSRLIPPDLRVRLARHAVPLARIKTPPPEQRELDEFGSEEAAG